MNAFRSIAESFGILLSSGARTIRVIDTAALDGDIVEIVLRKSRSGCDAALRGQHPRLSLFISAITATLVFLALRRLIVRRSRR